MKMNRVKILIVEDDQLIALDLETTLLSYNYIVCGIAQSGDEAVELTHIQKPDIVIMDIIIAGEMNGIQTADIILKNYNTPVIFLSGLTDDETFLSATAVSHYGYLNKPFIEGELKLKIEQALLSFRRKKVS